MSEHFYNYNLSWTALTSDVAALARASESNPTVAGIEYDSRRVAAGSVFVAMRGGSTDGNRYIDATIKLGASGVVTDSPDAYHALSRRYPQLPRMLVAHGRRALGQLAATFFQNPENKVSATGVTGTNGKTTTAFLIEALLNWASRSTVLVGTIEYHVAGIVRPSAHTTPESRDLFELMAQGVPLGATELVMEVSSHALDQGRVSGVSFDVAVFTNLTRDHLDYHGTMEEYFASKRLLFDGKRYAPPRVAILNGDDPHTHTLSLAAKSAGAEVFIYGISPGSQADWRAQDLKLLPRAQSLTWSARRV